MLPVQGIATQSQIDKRYLPGNVFYVFSVERIEFSGSQRRDVVYGGTSVPRFAFVPIVDYPQMGKNFAPNQNSGLAVFEDDRANQIARASQVNGGLPMTRKLAIHCIEELIENYRRWGLTDLAPLSEIAREEVPLVYAAVLPPYITKPGLEAIARATTKKADGTAHFSINDLRLVDENGREPEFDLPQLCKDLERKNYYPQLPQHLIPVAAAIQENLLSTVERAIEWRQMVLNRETAEVAASKTNGGKGLTSFTGTAKRYAASLNVELVDPVFVQAKAMQNSPAPVAPAATADNTALAAALNNIAAAMASLQVAAAPVVVPEVAPVEAAAPEVVADAKPAEPVKATKPANAAKSSTNKPATENKG